MESHALLDLPYYGSVSSGRIRQIVLPWTHCSELARHLPLFDFASLAVQTQGAHNGRKRGLFAWESP